MSSARVGEFWWSDTNNRFGWYHALDQRTWIACWMMFVCDVELRGAQAIIGHPTMSYPRVPLKLRKEPKTSFLNPSHINFLSIQSSRLYKITPRPPTCDDSLMVVSCLAQKASSQKIRINTPWRQRPDIGVHIYNMTWICNHKPNVRKSTPIVVARANTDRHAVSFTGWN